MNSRFSHRMLCHFTRSIQRVCYLIILLSADMQCCLHNCAAQIPLTGRCDCKWCSKSIPPISRLTHALFTFNCFILYVQICVQDLFFLIVIVRQSYVYNHCSSLSPSLSLCASPVPLIDVVLVEHAQDAFERVTILMLAAMGNKYRQSVNDELTFSTVYTETMHRAISVHDLLILIPLRINCCINGRRLIYSIAEPNS